MDELMQNELAKKNRRRFYAALGLFLIWVGVLGAMAVFSGRRPSSSPATLENR